jgi:MYXO-CTERM domain-containing protein
MQDKITEGWAFRVWADLTVTRHYAVEGSMKIMFAVALLALVSAAPAFAQAPPDTTTTDNSGVTRSYPSHNYGWLGLIGLAGLAGLRPRKSIDHERLESTGVTVKTVKV